MSLFIETLTKKAKSIYNLTLFPYILLALPFSILGAILAARGIPSFHQLFWIILAMFGARNGGMALNRLIDKDIDAQNPRTQNRTLPKGELSKTEAILLAVFFLSIFLYASYRLNSLCLTIAPFAILLLIIYSFLKRYTLFIHFFLGIIQSFAPIGGWIAIKGEVSYIPIIIGIGILFWTAGFDILDKCPDVEFDKSYGLHSIPQKFGIANALWFSRFFHLIFIIIFISIYYFYNLGTFFLTGILISGAILAYGHKLITSKDLSKVDSVVFYANISVSSTILIFTIIDLIF